jgi:hypothetical protein
MGPIVALLPHPIPEENGTGETLDGQEQKDCSLQDPGGLHLAHQTALKNNHRYSSMGSPISVTEFMTRES